MSSSSIFRIAKFLIKSAFHPTSQSINSHPHHHHLTPIQINQLQQSIQKIIKTHPIVIFSKSYCPYCSRTKTFLNDKLSSHQQQQPTHQSSSITTTKYSTQDIKVIFFFFLSHVLELDQLSEQGPLIQSILTTQILNRSKPITVPQIFINSQHIGGCDDLLTKEQTGQLDQILFSSKNQ